MSSSSAQPVRGLTLGIVSVDVTRWPFAALTPALSRRERE
jgi:hypothetical protein